ncbi:hypothetical protein ACGF0J_26380 [Nonomuraea sp. NPDC047897]|uniref:hypothetical protein n=1 Tax=Nonomuraea sp. NPDC047897 TaxID=3364346 RepID=UPI00371BBF1C
MTMRSAPVGVALALALGGCGTSTATRPPSTSTSTPTSTSTSTPRHDREHEVQVLKADCMKGKGFRYVPFVYPDTPSSETDWPLRSGDHEAEKAFRTKYGFGISSILVYRDEMPGSGPLPDNPNDAIRNDLSDAQQKAYAKASNACESQAIKKVTGMDVTDAHDHSSKVNVLINRQLRSEIDGDPELVRLASAMADCMVTKGHRMTSTKPLDVAKWGGAVIGRELHELARRDDTSIPPYDPENDSGYLPKLSPAEARRVLDREIRLALDDLECGKDFYRLYRPKADKVVAEVDERYGL